MWFFTSRPPRRLRKNFHSSRQLCFRPILESLEDRTLPTVVFTPVLGADTLQPTPNNDFNFQTLSSPTVYLIYWGRFWGNTTLGGPQEVKTLTDDVQTLLSSPIAGALTVYGSDGKAFYGGSYVDSSADPPKDFKPDGYGTQSQIDVQNEITSVINNASSGILAPPANGDAIYTVITAVNASASYSDGGFYTPPGGSTVPMQMISLSFSPGDPTGTAWVFSHELLEGMSDPFGMNQPATNTGVSVKEPSDLTSNFDLAHQICDGEAGPYYYRLGGQGGLKIAPCWSNTYLSPGQPIIGQGNFVVDDGNSEQVTLQAAAGAWSPDSQGNLQFNGQFTLTVGPTDGTVTFDETSSGLQLDINGQQFFFDAGTIVGTTINLGSGNDTVNVEGTVSTQTATQTISDPVTINLGSGRDTVNITPTAQSLTSIQANVTIIGGGGVGALNVDDQKAGFVSWNVTGSSVSRELAAPIYYTNLTNLVINGGFGFDNYTVPNNGGLASTTINTGGSGSTINVLATTTPLTINSGGPDTVTVGDGSGVQGVQGQLLVNGHGDALILNDQPDGTARTVAIDSTSVTGLSSFAAIDYSNLAVLTVNGGRGGAEFDLSPATKDLDGLPVINLHGLGSSDTAVLDDQNNSHFSTWSATGSSVSRTWVFLLGEKIALPATSTVNYTGLANVVLNGGSGGSEFDLSPTANDLDELPAITLHGGGSADTAVLDDQTNPHFSTWSVTGSSVTRTWVFLVAGKVPIPVTSTVTYTGLASLVLNGGSGGSEFDLSPTAKDLDELPAITLHGGGSADTAVLDDQTNPHFSTWLVTGSSVTRTWQFLLGGKIPILLTRTLNYTGLTSLVLNGGSGGSEFDLSPSSHNVDELPAAVTVNGSGTPDTLQVFDQGNLVASQWTIGSASLSRTERNPGPTAIVRTINYSSVTALTLDAGGPVPGIGNALTVNGTPAGMALTISTGFQNDGTVLEVASIGGPVTLNTQVGDTTELFDGPATGNGRVYTINSGSVTSSDGFSLTINYPAVSFFDEGFALIPGNPFNQTIDFQSEPFGVGWLLFPIATGNDTVNIGDPVNGMAAVQGDVSLDSGSAASVALNVNDPAGSAAQSYTLGFDSTLDEDSIVRATSPISPGGAREGRIFYNASSNRVAGLTFNGGNGSDTYVVQTIPVIQNPPGEPSSLVPQVTFNGGASLQGPNAPNTWQLTGLNTGTLDSTVAFEGVPNLIGGNNDVFQVQTGGGLTGALNGGAGTSTLDYSQDVGNITVVLPLGVATGFAGGVSNIDNVTGSQGNDLIVGGANPGVFIGGTGRNLIISGAGADQITGGGGDNILIGGTTAYDTNLTALDAVFAEWTSSQAIGQRIQAIRKGIAVGGQTYALNKTTVSADSAPDSLIGGGGSNWFFVDSDDTINDGAGPGPNDNVTHV